MERDCAVCCESFNRSSRKQYSCAFCGFTTCTACIQKFIVTVDDPECMSCKRPWTNDMVESALTKSFVTGTLKKHREDVLLNRERSLLPASQMEVHRRYQVQVLRSKVDALEKDLAIAVNEWRAAASTKQIAERRQFVKQCPVAECRGFLSTQYKCGLCSVDVCPDCHEIKVGEHVCNTDLVASVHAIKNDCKSCPRCGTMIFRIFGCNQMYCTFPGCNTAFCWVTLRIVDAGRIHNPHYYEYLQQQQGDDRALPRELDDIPCGGMPDATMLCRAIAANDVEIASGLAYPKRMKDILKEIVKKHSVLMTMHRFSTHVQYHELMLYPAAPDVVNPDDNQNIRVSFLMGKVSEERLKEILQQREKQRRKKNMIHQILSTVANVSSDLFRKVVVEKGTPEVIKEVMDEMKGLRKYANESLASMSRRYSCVVPYISADWETPLRTAKVLRGPHAHMLGDFALV